MTFEKPLIIAHRGASALAPENTRAAFRRAVDDQADGIEFDVRLAKDGVPIVIHDANLRRLARIETRVADLTAEELSRIDVGTWFNRARPTRADEKFSVETVPTLADTFDLLRDFRGLLYVELKGSDSMLPALAAKVCELIRQTNRISDIIIKSFKLKAFETVKEILPEAKTAALFEPKILTILGKKRRILDEARRCGADEISLHYTLATKSFVRRARENNLQTVIWTADNPIWVKRAIDYGIKAIITNDPAKLLAERTRILREL